MDLEKVTAQIRPRRGWEAIDLGISLVQQHAKTLYKIWFVISLPFFLIFALLLNSEPTIMILSLWWIKPILERPLLHFLSRELFGEGLTAKQCIKAFFSLAKIQWFASLSWRRLSFTRSFDLPLIQLEGLKGQDRTRRLRVIHSGDSGSAVWLTIIFALTETIFYFSFISFIFLLIPEIYLENFDLWKWMTADSESNLTAFVFNLLSYLGMSIVAPFYVACGFALYLNQRTHLEAWDIELSFKRLATRLTEKSSNIKVNLASLLFASFFALAIGGIYPTDASAEQEPSIIESQQQSSIEDSLKKAEREFEDKLADKNETAVTNNNDIEEINHEQAKTIITEIKEGEDFHQIVTEENIRRIKSVETETKNSTSNYSSGWLIFAKIFALLVEFALWIFIAVLLIFLILKYRHLLVRATPNKKIKKARPEKLFGLDLNSDSLPEKPWLVAQELIEQKKFREALSLLYRASLVWYIENSEVLIKEGYTELECLKQIAKHTAKNNHTYLKNLTNSWRNLAYAHLTPSVEDMQNLCTHWPKVMRSNTDLQSNSDINKTSSKEASQ